MKNKVVFFTVVYPGVEKFLDDFFNSLCRQTFQEFDVLVFNDGVRGLWDYCRPYNELKVIEISATGTPSKIREQGICYLLSNTEYEYIVFGDSDDCFPDERLHVVLELLNEYDIVVNDLDLFNDDDVLSRGYISQRIASGTEINAEMLMRSNIMGLSNTSVRRECLTLEALPGNLIAVDWYLFSRMLHQGFCAVFTDETKTDYRQYEDNTVGIGTISKEKLLRLITVKNLHYQEMAKDYPEYMSLVETYSQMRSLVEENKDMLTLFLDKIENAKIANPLWWEETTVLEDIVL